MEKITKKILSVVLAFLMMLNVLTGLIPYRVVKAQNDNNDKVFVSISKIDENGYLLPGAKLKVTDSQNNTIIIEEWKTEKEPKIVELSPGTYNLVEVEAPEGYKKAEAKKFTVSAQNVNTETDEKEYTAWTDPNKYNGQNEIKNPIYISPKDDEDNNVVGYCFNTNKRFPLGKSTNLVAYKNIVYKKLNYTDDLYSNIAEGADKDINEAILKVVWNGYSGDGKEKSIQKKYKLTEGQFREITQKAIWKFTDNGFENLIWSKNMKEAYKELVDYKKLPRHPKNMVLNIYKSYNNDGSEDNNYQNLLSTKFVPAKMLEVKLMNTKKEISKETTVNFSKQDIAGKELKGAKITLTGENGEKEEWISDGTVKEFTVKEGKYTFEETIAPKGYKIATKITFEVVRNEETKELEIKNVKVGEGNKYEDGIIKMVDEAIEETKKENKVETKKETNREIRKENNSNPKTGDEGVASFVAILLISVTAFFVSRKKEIK